MSSDINNIYAILKLRTLSSRTKIIVNDDSELTFNQTLHFLASVSIIIILIINTLYKCYILHDYTSFHINHYRCKDNAFFLNSEYMNTKTFFSFR